MNPMRQNRDLCMGLGGCTRTPWHRLDVLSLPNPRAVLHSRDTQLAHAEVSALFSGLVSTQVLPSSLLLSQPVNDFECSQIPYRGYSHLSL